MFRLVKNLKSTAIFLISASFILSCELLVVSGQKQPEVIVESSNNCEANKSRFDLIWSESKDIGGNPVIIIARLGDGEKLRKYNSQRLYEISTYLKRIGVPKENIVTAQGERINGKGQVEVYLNGKLSYIFIVGRRENLKGRECGIE